MIDDSHEHRVRPSVDAIPSPFLAAAYSHGDLAPDEDGAVSDKALEELLARVGFDPSLRTKLAPRAGRGGGDVRRYLTDKDMAGLWLDGHYPKGGHGLPGIPQPQEGFR